MTLTTTLPVAGEWFRSTAIDDSITLIDEPHVHPLLQANLWHIKGQDRDVLIDAGLGVTALLDAFPSLLSDREPVLVLTHAHLDHMGSAHEFAERWAHVAEPVDVSGRGSLQGPTLGRLLGMTDAVSDTLPALLLDAVPTAGYDPLAYELQPVSLTRSLEEGDEIDLGARGLRVLHLPGHSPGSIALYDETNRILFSGDVIYDGHLIDDIDGCDRDQYVDTMLRLRGLDVGVVHTGHGESLDGIRMRHIIDHYLTTRVRDSDIDRR
jgi:glyoxylase-like metal-dependent hydrolase (beta-lactamase superfamily II)